MPTNAQMERADELAATRTRIKLIQEGLLEPIDGKSKTLHPMRFRTRSWGDSGQHGGGVPDYGIAATRQIRHRTPSGVTSFHFAHSAVTKVTYRTLVEGKPHMPGAAAAHGRYLERESAVADLITEQQGQGTERAADVDSSPDPEGISPTSASAVQRGAPIPTQMENDHVTATSPFDASDIQTMVEDLGTSEPHLGSVDGEGSLEDPGPDADLFLLSGRDLVCDRGASERLLLSPEDVSLAAGPGSERLRCPSNGDQEARGKKVEDEDLTLGAAFDRYLTRPSALAIQPDHSRALITNIDEDDKERAGFWGQVEEYERTPSPDTIAFRYCDYRPFWDAVLLQSDCPKEIREKIEGPHRDSDKPIEIKHGTKVQAFLRRQPGWVKPGPKKRKAKKAKTQEQPVDVAEEPPPIAEVTIGRGGRTQYRINGELPAELTPSQNFALLQDFAREFERRELPFLAVMHAPDHHNHDRNWHFHLAYYDRPVRRITEADIERLAARGFDVSQLSPGQWDFTVELKVPRRTDKRTTFPLRQNKVAEVSRSRAWPKTLRVALAKVTNRHLSAAGIARRVSPETFEDLGIPADPHEHLSTTANAMETRGVATAAGIRNENKQWAAILAQAEARYRAELEAAETRITQTLSGQSLGNGDGLAKHKELRVQLEQAAKLRRDAFLLEQELERARSRAVMVRERNLKLLKAGEADPKTTTAKRMAEHRSLVASATRYLISLEEELADVTMLAARWRASARRCDARAAEIESELKMPNEQSADTGKALSGREQIIDRIAAAVMQAPPSDQSLPDHPLSRAEQDRAIQRRIDEIKEEVRKENEMKRAAPNQAVEQGPDSEQSRRQSPQMPHPGLGRGW
ncbi:MobA/MobL family protein [Erythrobacter sp. sf7]|uniref:MobA/MobL family protein n=1 Tax=Erythrobacter fulvus TaxID=2987523 RepID=A0ABT5JP42_9SPHN|nr:MobA/MobL family protein [Erythrobacter fulvus]MDC8753836.1 MobA/MobL family protein [Erythrobacter fulvus]